MTYQIQQCSPKASARIDWDWAAKNPVKLPNVGIVSESKPEYPFECIAFAECFIIPFEDKNEKTLRNRVAVQNKKDERKFIVVKHTEFGCYEVARVK